MSGEKADPAPASRLEKVRRTVRTRDVIDTESTDRTLEVLDLSISLTRGIKT